MVLGLFFSICGIITIGNKHYIFNVWLVSLGFSFLIDPFTLYFLTRDNLQSLKIINYTIYGITIISGVIVFSMEFYNG